MSLVQYKRPNTKNYFENGRYMYGMTQDQVDRFKIEMEKIRKNKYKRKKIL
jgi:hypothetical protein